MFNHSSACVQSTEIVSLKDFLCNFLHHLISHLWKQLVYIYWLHSISLHSIFKMHSLSVYIETCIEYSQNAIFAVLHSYHCFVPLSCIQNNFILRTEKHTVLNLIFIFLSTPSRCVCFRKGTRFVIFSIGDYLNRPT